MAVDEVVVAEAAAGGNKHPWSARAVPTGLLRGLGVGGWQPLHHHC